MPLIDGGAPLELRTYQAECAAECERRNVLCALPVGSGKTVIAAEVIQQALVRHEDKKVVFLVPYGQLALQQFSLLLRQIDRLHHGENVTPKSDATPAELARWRAGIVVGQSVDDVRTTSYRRGFVDCQLLVMTPALFEKALTHACVAMSDLALLVLDEAHHTRKDEFFATIMSHYFHPTMPQARPRILGLTASPAHMPEVKEMEKMERKALETGGLPLETQMQNKVKEQLNGMEDMLNARLWSAPVEVMAEAANGAAPRWIGESSLEFFEETKEDELPALSREIVHFVRQCKPSRGGDTLAEIWEPRIVSKIERVGCELGAWACFQSARLLAVVLMEARLHEEPVWFEKEDDESTNQPRTHMSADLQHATGSQLQEAIAHLEGSVPRPVDAAGCSDKVGQLVRYVNQQQPQKCLVFATRRIVAKLLADLLGLLLPWNVDCLMAVRGGRHEEAFSAVQHDRVIGAFRADLRLLVATATVEEGLDVPTCDCVVNFDTPTTARALLQRGGRARAPGSSYATLVSSNDEKTLQQQLRMREWNAMVDAKLRERGTQASPIAPPSKIVDLERDALKITATGALLPVQRAPDFLKSVVYCDRIALGGDQRQDLFHTTDGTKFRTSEYFSFDQSTGRMTLHLPEVTLCSAQPDPALLPYTIQLPERFSNKKEAELRTSLAALRHLHAIGVLDDYLHVVGRAEALASIADKAGSPMRGSRRANAHELALKEPVQRRLPRCFEPLDELTAALSPSDTRSAMRVTLHLHTFMLDGMETGLGVLLPSACPPLDPFQLGPDGKVRLTCQIGPTREYAIDASNLARLTAWQVATFDLLQAGNAHEPLHPLLRAPEQMVRWDNEKGTYASAHIASGEHVPRVATEPSRQARRWLEEAPSGEMAQLEWLKTRLAPFVAPAAGGGQSSSRLVPIFDLDRTMWFGQCDEWPSRGLQRVPDGSDGRLQVYEPSVGYLELFPDVPLILRALRSLGAPFGIASASAARESAHALLEAFELDPSQMVIEMRDPADGNTSKEGMLRRLADERLGVPLESMVLFDDTLEHLTTARGMNAGGRLIDPLNDGLTVDALLAGLEGHAAERRSRGELDDRGFTKAEQGIANFEDRRRAAQNRHGREGEKHALVDEAPARARLEKLEVTPGFWIAAPLRTDAAIGTDAATASHDPIDWGLVDHVHSYCAAKSLGGHACQWPSLDEREEPLVAQHLRPVPRADTPTSENPPVLRLELCALMRWPSMHFDLFKEVAVHEDGTASGYKRTRGINVSATAATRTQQAGGRHKTEGTLYRKNYQQRRVHVLPLKSAHIDALLCLRRVIWRMQSLALLAETNGLRDLHAPSGEWLPSNLVPVPLPLLAAALTHREAAAEAPEPPVTLAAAAEHDLDAGSLAPPTLDATRMDVRGCCDYEVLEWLGDAALDLLAKSIVMALHDTDGVQMLNPQAELLLMNKNLWRRGKRIDAPCLALFSPFEVRRRLPDMTKQLMAPKAQADLMEAMMGALCLAQIEDAATREVERSTSSQPLARGLDAAFAFFLTFVCGESAQQQTADRQLSDAATMLRATMRTVTRPEARAHADEMGTAINAAFLPQASFIHRRDLLQECCAWSDDKKEGKPFQRLELLGDAFLQCMRHATRAAPHSMPHVARSPSSARVHAHVCVCACVRLQTRSRWSCTGAIRASVTASCRTCARHW